jgi:hypothetical protein
MVPPARGPRLAAAAGMTTKTKGQRPDAKSGKAPAPPTPTKPQPGTDVPRATSDSDLEARVKVRRVELVARLRELREDTRHEAGEAGDKLKAKLSEVGHIIKDGVVDGWSSLGDAVKQKLERWLAESVRPVPPQSVPARNEQSH